MKNTKITIIFTSIFICMAAVSSTFAQAVETKRFEVSGEYSYFYAKQVLFANSVPNGFSGGVAYKFNKWFGVYGEVGFDRLKTGSSASDRVTTRKSFLGGIRFYFANKTRFTPFINAGVGRVLFQTVNHHNGQSNTAVDLGNLLFVAGEGVDIAINRKRTIQFRVGAEYRRAEVGGSVNSVCYGPCTGPVDMTGNAFRFHTGLVFNF